RVNIGCVYFREIHLSVAGAGRVILLEVAATNCGRICPRKFNKITGGVVPIGMLNQQIIASTVAPDEVLIGREVSRSRDFEIADRPIWRAVRSPGIDPNIEGSA